MITNHNEILTVLCDAQGWLALAKVSSVISQMGEQAAYHNTMNKLRKSITELQTVVEDERAESAHHG